VFKSDEHINLLNQVFELRNKAVMSNNSKNNEEIYDIQNKYGLWSYQYEDKRVEYLNKWAEKQGIVFTNINSKIDITRENKDESGYSFKFICSTEYQYAYKDNIEKANLFRIVTYPYILMVEKDGKWLIRKEWCLDPFEYSLHDYSISSDFIKNCILSKEPRDFSALNKRRIQALQYADKYCGASEDPEQGVMYNKKYSNYNGIGGDCTNFISQVLYEGGSFKKDSQWNYNKGGSGAWVRAETFLDYMVYSGRASIIASGPYEKVLEASYRLEPGDLICYQRKGRIEHTVVVTGADAKGYTLINCHTVDEYRVPWDLGWNSKEVKFYLLRVHY
jgi:hypothetical protein